MKEKFNLTLLFTFFIFLLSSCNNDNNNDTPQPTPGEDNIQKYVQVLHNPGSDTITFTFSKNGNWKVYKGDAVDDIDMSAPAGSTTTNKIELTGLDSLKRYYFNVTLDDNSQAIVSETKIAVKGQPNLRDLGGMINKDGKSIVWGKVYRSGELGKLTDNDIKYIESLKLDNVIDFRFEEEVIESPDKLPDNVNYIPLPIEDSLMHRSVMTNWLLTNDTAAFDTIMYYYYKVIIKEHQDAYKEFFDELETGKTTLFHCTAGKDRTGIATALFLYALDVDDETIMEDYLKSNEYLEELNQKTVDYVNSIGLNGDILWPMLEVKEGYLKAAFNTIDSEYGGMDNFLDNVLGVDRNKLKELYLQQ